MDFYSPSFLLCNNLHNFLFQKTVQHGGVKAGAGALRASLVSGAADRGGRSSSAGNSDVMEHMACQPGSAQCRGTGGRPHRDLEKTME